VLAGWADFAVVALRGHGADAAALQARHQLNESGIESVALITVDDAPSKVDEGELMARAA
jgi:hypothetical protein